MSEEGIKFRVKLKAAKRKFTEEEEHILVGWVIYQDLAMLSSTNAKFKEYVLRMNNLIDMINLVFFRKLWQS